MAQLEAGQGSHQQVIQLWTLTVRRIRRGEVAERDQFAALRIGPGIRLAGFYTAPG